MKGSIYCGLADFIEKSYGSTHWLKAVKACELPSNAEFISTEIYDDSEFELLIDKLSIFLVIEKEALVRDFGAYFFPTLMSLALSHVKDITDLFSFLHAVDSVIHIEVQKADPLAYTPTLLYDQPHENELMIRYVSSRKMCHFAEGLILGAAKHFSQKITISQSKCMCKGDEYCLISIVMS